MAITKEKLELARKMIAEQKARENSEGGEKATAEAAAKKAEREARELERQNKLAERKQERAQAREARREEQLLKQKQRAEIRQAKREARLAKQSGRLAPHTRKVEALRAKLPPLTENLSALADDLESFTDQELAAARQYLEFEARRRAIEASVSLVGTFKVGDRVVIVSHHDVRNIGLVGVVCEARRVRLFVECDQRDVPIYCWNSDVRPWSEELDGNPSEEVRTEENPVTSASADHDDDSDEESLDEESWETEEPAPSATGTEG